MEKDYYQVLQLKPPVTEEDLRQAYRTLAKQYHPDVNPDPDAHIKFLEIAEAYEFLLRQVAKNQEPVSDYNESQREYFEEMRRMARERAREKARIKREKKEKQEEEFRISGLYDLVLLASYLGRYLLVLGCLWLLAAPVIMTLGTTETPVIVRVFMVLLGGFGLYQILSHLRSFFIPRPFYYNLSRLKGYFSFKEADILEDCFYSPGHNADSRPYRVDMIKIKDIRLHNYGPVQHGVSFDAKTRTISVNRSRHALIVHSCIIPVKLGIMLFSVLFFPVDSYLWRLLFGMLIALIISRLILFFAHTRSSSSFLVTPGLVFRCMFWTFFLMLGSEFQLHPFNIFTSEFVYGMVVIICILDTFLNQLLNFISGNRFSLPIFPQPASYLENLERKYQFGYDMPLFSVFYPVYKWIFG